MSKGERVGKTKPEAYSTVIRNVTQESISQVIFLILKKLSFHTLKRDFKILNKISEIYPSKRRANQWTKLNLVSTE